MNCLKCLLKINDLPHYGLHSECFIQWFKIPVIAEFLGLQRRSSTTTDRIEAINTSFFHGKFKKYSAHLNGESYILKMRQEDAPELPEVEYLCNQISQLLGLPVAEFYFIDFHGDKTFVTKNFVQGGSLADLQHIYHFNKDNEYSCENIINIISQKTQRPHEVKIFIKTILVDALIGNHDRHGRNLGLIVTVNNISLAPIYDNVSYLSLEQGNMLKANFNPTGKISTSDTYEPSMRDYVKELIRLSYQDEVYEFYRSINPTKLHQLIDKSFCSPLMKIAIKTLVENRLEELKNEIQP